MFMFHLPCNDPCVFASPVTSESHKRFFFFLSFFGPLTSLADARTDVCENFLRAENMASAVSCLVLVDATRQQ